MSLSSHIFKARTLAFLSRWLTILIVALWILSEFKRLAISRAWQLSKTRPDPSNPPITLLDDAWGSWELSSNSGSLQLYQAHSYFTLDVHAAAEPIATTPLSVRWSTTFDHARQEEWDDHSGFLGFKSTTLVVRISMFIPGPVRDEDHHRHALVIPYWSLAFTAAAPALFHFTAKRVRNRKARALIAQCLCQTCGYDLRASHHRCPECGTPIPPKS